MTRRTDTNLTHAIVDMKTGKVVGDVNIAPEGKSRYCFPGGFAFMSMILVSKLSEMKLPADGMRLMFRAMADANFGGYVTQPNSYYADRLGIGKSRVSRLMGILHKAGLLHRVGTRTVFLNPAYFWRGTVEEQRKAIDTWAELRRSEMRKAA